DLATRRGVASRSVAFICSDYTPSFEWCAPPIAHFRWSEQVIGRRVVRWVENVARGKEDRRQQLTPAKFVGGETLPRVDDA
ncbi:MAG TPA: hypothetical protein VJ952_09965, partial [Opitutales bacterium]|nr:hypothetical protein [Opitutales bacterium]